MQWIFTPIDYDYFDYEGKTYARIVGRTEGGKRICVVDDCDVYFWVIINAGVSESRIKGIAQKIGEIRVAGKLREGSVLKTEICTKYFLGEKVRAIKVYVSNYKDAQEITRQIDFKEVVHRREYDIGFVTRYIREKKVNPLSWYEVSGEVIVGDEYGGVSNFAVDFCVRARSFKEIKKEGYTPKILAYDIETDGFEIGKEPIVMNSIVGEGCKKVLTWKGKSTTKGVIHYKDEGAMLAGFVDEVKKYDPDILVGYFCDGFDLPYLKARGEAVSEPLALGLDGSGPIFSRGRLLTGKIKGIVHIDLFRFIRSAYSQYLQSESLSLNDVAFELLGAKKLEWKHTHSSQVKAQDWENYFAYNLRDSEITYDLALQLWPDLVEFSRVIGEPLFTVSRDSMSAQIENYIIHHIDEYDEIVEKKPYTTEIGARREEEKYEGAFVYEPKPGLYEDVVFFDFTSMYGSVIVSFNLSKSSFREHKESGVQEVMLDRKVYFLKKGVFFPQMIGAMITKRKEFKKDYQKNPSPLLKARSNAFKLLVNAAYGYQGFFGARYYCREAAAATAAFAREQIKKTIALIEKKGYSIVYSDTDSIAFLQGKKTKHEIGELLLTVNKTLPGIMELDLEGFFCRGIWVLKRNGEVGAKKKYALLGEDGKLKIRGFETVRRDWCPLARETHNTILKMVLEDGNEKRALVYVTTIITQPKKREIQKEKLIIRTQLKRGVNEYRSEGPHVTIAKKMQMLGMPVNVGMLVSYYIGEPSGKKKSLVRERARLVEEPGDYDVEYYLRNQILPAVETILEVFGVKGGELIAEKKQKSLGEF